MEIQEPLPVGILHSLRRRPRVLVVDDDPDIRLICATNLRLDGFDVLEAADGREGLERVAADAPDLVLLDVSMPLLDGFELAAAVRLDHRTSHLPIVFLTGETAREAEAQAVEVGAAGYFTKPFDPIALSRFVGQVLEQQGEPPDTAA